MRVLIIKMSSMGDIIHTLPALTEAGNAIPDIRFDWVVEENFAEIPRWHPLVDKIIPVAIRRWRKKIFSRQTLFQWLAFRRLLQATSYDLIIDAQGLSKSAFISLNARGKSAGLSFRSARDPFATLFYRKKCVVGPKQHAIQRVRSLFSQALRYSFTENSVPDYGIERKNFYTEEHLQDYVVFLHGTTWATKHWPEEYWVKLAQKISERGVLIKLPWSSAAELGRMQRIAEQVKHAEVLPQLDLKNMAGVLAGAKAIVAVDTGLGHLAAALGVPTISLYGPTDPLLTGALGESQIHLTADFPGAPCFSRKCTYPRESGMLVKPACFSALPPTVVWQAIVKLL